MEFRFIPYSLNEDISSFAGVIQWVGEDNGVELYRIKNEAVNPMLGLKVINIHLYFFETNLITVYFYMDYKSSDINRLLQILESTVKQEAKKVNSGKGVAYCWINQTESLGLLNNRDTGRICLCYMLRKFSVFESSP